MGFDIFITMTLQMCPETGKPYYYKYNKYTGVNKIYEIPSLEVPQQLRKYLVGRGHFFHAYTDHFNDREVYDTSVDVFLEEFPTWEDVTGYEAYHEDIPEFWNEEDHENFKKLLQWCSVQDCSFRVVWSY